MNVVIGLKWVWQEGRGALWMRRILPGSWLRTLLGRERRPNWRGALVVNWRSALAGDR